MTKGSGDSAIRSDIKCEQGKLNDTPIDRTSASVETQPIPLLSVYDLQVGLASDPGRVRERNEDACLALQFMLAQHGEDPLPVGLFLVADGMGGHAGGQEASALAARLVARHIIRHVHLPLLSDEDEAVVRAPINEVLEDSIRIAHDSLVRRLPTAGTTLTVALVLGEGLYVAHVGDSRAYVGQRGRLKLLTRDHSMAARLLEMNQTTLDEASLQRNLLYKALGQGARVDPDILYHDLYPGQYLLLCCDGLWDMVSDEEISAIVETSSTPGSACRKLVTRANEHGGEDNISVVLAARIWPLPAF